MDTLVETRELGLAAYIKIQGGKLVGYKDRMFTFGTTKDLDAWRIDYLQSECQRHDQEVLALRKFVV